MSTVRDTIASSGFQVPSLTRKDNYKTWKINMVDILSDMDLLDHIEKKPKELHAADATAAIKTKILKMDQKTLVKSNSGALLLPEFILKIPYLQRMHGR